MILSSDGDGDSISYILHLTLGCQPAGTHDLLLTFVHGVFSNWNSRSWLQLSWHQGNSATVLAMRSDPPCLCPRVLVFAFYAGEFLHHSCDNVSRFGADQLLRRTRPRPSTEGDKRPKGLQAFPTLWTELVGIRAPDVLVLVQTVEIERDVIAFPHQDRGCAVRAATGGENGVVENNARVVV